MATPTHPFLAAAAAGNVDSLKEQYHPTLQHVADADGRNALHHAAAEGQQEVLVYLTSIGFEVNARTKKGGFCRLVALY
jgi:ankyrin repeat protein